MNRVRVKVIIFPANIDLSRVDNYDESIYGKTFSSLDQIHVNNITDGYSIIYTADLFEQIDTTLFADNVISLLINSLPKTIIDIDITYFYLGKFSEDCGTAVLNFDQYMTDINNPLIEYNESPSVKHLIDSWDDEIMEFDLSLYEDYTNSPCIYDDDDEDDDDDGYDLCNICGQPFCICGNNDDDDDEDIDSMYQLKSFLGDDKGEMKKKNYGRSRVIKESPKLKRNIKRHGVIIAPDKNARKRDEKIIRAFLKDFMPGKERWMKEYREEVLKRWVATYAISKKQAKRLSKAHKRKHANSNKSSMTKERAMDLTRSIFQPDLWGDTNR